MNNVIPFPSKKVEAIDPTENTRLVQEQVTMVVCECGATEVQLILRQGVKSVLCLGCGRFFNGITWSTPQLD